ncbi:hypothetical protein EST38_g13160 [Candolleomyces aberdarensis]|uniref:C2H2-type domain-containing protein n=1 Tax=Candolleomyces aberdarensis TaxID=2316362 RepID=A0A4Q2D0L7_9AGAR|nr:hypothetical protein EST38_g13160 [Candolleomyces aberdarensis]
MDVSASDPQVLRSPITLKPSLRAVRFPSPSSPSPSSPSPGGTRASSPSLDNIDMPSSIVSFGTYTGVAPDITQAFVLHTHEDFVRITSIERQVCSNYVCCGVHLVDFHALINHFEEKHVSVVAPNGKRIYPPERLKPANPPPVNSNRPPSPSSSSSSSSRSSSVASSPPNTPQTPASLPLGFSAPAVQVVAAAAEVEYNPYMGLALSVPPSSIPPNQRFPESSDVISAFGPEYDFSKDYAYYEQSYAERIHRLHERERREKEERERETRIKVEQAAPTSCLAQEEEEGMSDDSAVPSLHFDSNSPEFSQKPVAIASSSTKKKGSPKARREGSESPGEEGSTVSNNGGKVVKPKLKLASTSNGATGGNPISSGGRKREKMFKCPHQGCTKSYLNPNGLKYHLEKGTCKFDYPVNGATSASASASPLEGPAESASTPSSPKLQPSSSTSNPVSPSSVTPAPSEQPPVSTLPVSLNPSASYTFQYASSPIHPTLLTSSNVPSSSVSHLQIHPASTSLAAPTARYPATAFNAEMFRSTLMSHQAQAAARVPSSQDPDHDAGDGTSTAVGDRDECPASISTTTSPLTIAGTTSVPVPDQLLTGPVQNVVDQQRSGDGLRDAAAQSRFLHVVGRVHGQVSSSL